MSASRKHPASTTPFIDVRVRDLSLSPTLRGLCAGYEAGKWRMEDFARHAIEWLPEFALDYSERQDMGSHNAVKLIAKAAEAVYTSEKYQARGEFGELFLHMILRQDCDSSTAISKIYFKTASNETVKGFDAVHVVGNPGDLELWLGEVKFYNDISAAIRDVVLELEKHVEHDYLRSEFLWIGNKLDPNDPHAPEVAKLIDRNTSLDTIFKRLCIPVLLTYDSSCVSAHTSTAPGYPAAFEAEIRKHHAALVAKGLPAGLRVHLFLLPLSDKAAFVKELDRRLKLWQQM